MEIPSLNLFIFFTQSWSEVYHVIEITSGVIKDSPVTGWGGLSKQSKFN